MRRRSIALFTSLGLLVLAACTVRESATPESPTTTSRGSSSTAAGTSTIVPRSTDEHCEAIGQRRRPPDDAPSRTAREFRAGIEQDLRVDVAEYPLPGDHGDPWSQWGQGVVLSDGTHLSAVGDHLGQDGDSHLYEYDPRRGTLTLVASVSDAISQPPGHWGYGKIHGAMVPVGCQSVVLATFWGTRRGLVTDDVYRGDHLLRYDIATRSLHDLGVPVPGHGIPSLAGANGLVFGEALDPASPADAGPFFAYDVASDAVLFRGDTAHHVGFRGIAVTSDDDALFAADGGRIRRYDPVAGEVDDLPTLLPNGGWLRAASAPGPDGTIHLSTREPDQIVSLYPDGTIETAVEDVDYVSSLALTPDGRTLYFVPGAHGGSDRNGTPLVALDTVTGDVSEVVRLDDVIEPAFDVRVGGSYNVTVDPSGSPVFVGLNAGVHNKTFGRVLLAAVHVGS